MSDAARPWDDLDQIDLPPLERRAVIPRSSINAEQRTVEVVWTTGARALVSRGRFEPFYEELSLDPKHVNLGRLTSGNAPVLAAHRGDDLNDTIGVVERAHIAKGEGLAVLRFAKGDPVADSVWNKIEQGVLRNISVGYRVYKYEKQGDADSFPVLRAVDWEPHEISIVSMPVDAQAYIRADQANTTTPCILVRGVQEPTMDDLTLPARAESSILPAHVPVVVPAGPAEPEPVSERELGRAIEQERIRGILDGCEAARLRMSFAQDLITRNVSLVDARGLILGQMRQNPDLPNPVPTGVNGGASAVLDARGQGGVKVVGADPVEHVWRGIQNALLSRIAPQYFKLEEIGRPYQSRSALAFIELCLHHRGINTTAMTKNELVSAGLGYGTRGSGFNSTSDFANLLVDAIGKTLRAAYTQMAQSFDPITRRMSLSDFKTMNLVQFGEAPALLEVKEHGEFLRGPIQDAKETIRLKTYGRVFPITRQALINDDLNGFGEVPAAFARSARQKESDLVWAEITANGTMGDGNALFVAAHGNLDSSGNAIDDVVIGEGFAAMRIQKGLDGTTPLNIQPRYLIVPVGKEALALKYTSVITPATGATVMPYASRLTVIVEPRLDTASTTAWYLAASPDDVPIIALAFLDGQDTPMVETRTGFEIDGIEIKCRHDVAAKVVDWRGLFKNVGA